MKYRTKQKRLIAIADAWMERHGKTAFEISVVSEWAIANDLWPVPTRGDSLEMCLEWEGRLERAPR